MKQLTTTLDYEQFLKTHDIALVYYSTLLCGVCHVMKPRVQQLLDLYPDIALAEVVIDELPEISSQQTIFSAPTIVLYVEEKEFLRQSGYLRLDNLEPLLIRLTDNIN